MPMAHDCIDWTARPPVRKIPLLVLARGSERVYTNVPKDYKTLEDIARREFRISVDADVRISSSCVNLCDRQPARITECAWEHLSPYIGCAIVEVTGPTLTLPYESVQLKKDSDRIRAATPEQSDQHEDIPVSPRKGRRPRVVVSEDEEEDGSDRERKSSPTPAPPPRSGKPESDSQPPAERQGEHPVTLRASPVQPPTDSPIKREKHDSGNGSYSQSQSQSSTQAPDATDNQKLMIRVAHRPSRQESKFTTKSTTKVAKVLAGACRSFGLNAHHATLYLIVSTEDEDGESENLFPCDRNDTIGGAGAEHERETRFLLTMTGET